jgi:hypothetical protein
MTLDQLQIVWTPNEVRVVYVKHGPEAEQALEPWDLRED